jgi:hypothetical protein
MPAAAFVLIALAAFAAAVPEPSCTTTKCVFDDPSATPAITDYPTTLTFSSSWSATTQSFDFEVGAADKPQVMTTEVQNVRTLEPHASSPTAYPATVVATGLTTHTYIVEGSTLPLSTETIFSTWMLHRPQPSDLPRYAKGICADCAQPAAYAPAPACAAAGNATACTRQCAQRDGNWYCFYKGRDMMHFEENVMGRVCSWFNPFYGITEYIMLGTPCVEGDRMMDCAACETYG